MSLEDSEMSSLFDMERSVEMLVLFREGYLATIQTWRSDSLMIMAWSPSSGCMTDTTFIKRLTVQGHWTKHPVSLKRPTLSFSRPLL